MLLVQDLGPTSIFIEVWKVLHQVRVIHKLRHELDDGKLPPSFRRLADLLTVGKLNSLLLLLEYLPNKVHGGKPRFRQI